jgi:hypothetical protein
VLEDKEPLCTVRYEGIRYVKYNTEAEFSDVIGTKGESFPPCYPAVTS